MTTKELESINPTNFSVEVRKAVRRRLRYWASIPALRREMQEEWDDCAARYVAMEDRLGAQTLSGTPPCTGFSDPGFAFVAAREKCLSRRAKAGRALARLRKTERRITQAVNALPAAQQRIIVLRFKRRLGWEAVARKVGYSVQHTKLLEGCAIDALADIAKR